ncbi:hypothetical protein J6590_074464 [Homalodisca vitripennis]|nr:hypothetical protein J6590_074464 [Homalodisca vitripennis]
MAFFLKQMLFLKDIVKPRASSSNLKPKLCTVTDGAEREDEVSHQEPDIDLNEAEIELSNRNVTETQPSELNQPENPPASQPTKRRRMMATNTLYNEKILQLEQRKIDTIQSALRRGPDNDDMMFFKSLLPIRIQQVVEEFAFMVGPLQQLSPGTSTGGRPTPQPSPSLSTSSYDSRPPSVDKYNQKYGHQPGTQSFPRHEESFPQHEENNSGLTLLRIRLTF